MKFVWIILGLSFIVLVRTFASADPNSSTTRPKTGVILTTGLSSGKPYRDQLLVTLHAKGTLADILRPLAKQTSVGFYKRTGYSFPPQTKIITIDADNLPLIEVVNEICAQAGLRVVEWRAGIPGTQPEVKLLVPPTPGADLLVGDALPVGAFVTDARPRIVLGGIEKGSSLGPWVVNAAFAYEAVSVSHSLNFAPIPGLDPEMVKVVVAVSGDPRLKSSVSSSRLELLEATDDHGNSLVLPDPRFAHPIPFNGSSEFRLKYPQNNPGARIAKLRCVDHTEVEREEEVLSIPYPITKLYTKEVGDMNLSISLESADKYNELFEMTLKRGKRSQFDFDRLKNAVIAHQPHLFTADGQRFRFGSQSIREVHDDMVRWECSFSASTEGNQYLDPKQLVMQVPVDVFAEDVNFELDDLPLP